MRGALPRKKKGVKILSPRTLALVAVFLLSVGIGTVGINASRDSQLATALAPETCEAKNSNCPQEDASNTYKCPVTQGKSKDKPPKNCVLGKVCTTQAAGKTIAGTCKCPQVCKGNADEATDKNDPGKEKEDGKMPELPKMPEPPKDSPSGGQSPTGTCKEGAAGGVDDKGQPCPGTKDTRVACLVDPTAAGCVGADTSTEGDKTPPTITEEPETPSKATSWIAVVRTLAKEATDAAKTTVNAVTNTVQEIGKSFGGNSSYGVGATDVVKYVDSKGAQAVPPVSMEGTQKQISAEVTGFTVQGNTGVSADLSGGSQADAGFWGKAAEALRNFLGRF